MLDGRREHGNGVLRDRVPEADVASHDDRRAESQRRWTDQRAER